MKATQTRQSRVPVVVQYSQRAHRMLLYALSACLWLLASGEQTIIEDARVRFHKSPTPLPPNHIIAPDILDGRRTFFVLDYDTIPSQNQMPPLLRIQVHKYDDNPGVQPYQCIFDHKVRSDSNSSGVSEFRRLSDDTFVYMWYDETRNGDRVTYIQYANVISCRTFDFSPNNFRGRTLLLPSVNETFYVLVDDAEYCGRLGKRCRVSYDISQTYKGTNLPFNVSIEWDTLYTEILPSGALLVRGYDNDTYKVMQMNRLTGDVSVFLRIPDKDRKMEFNSSGLAFCWILDPRKDRNTINCEMADERGQVVLTKNIKYDEPVTLIDVHPMKKEGELFVLAKKANCKNEADCWIIYGTRVNNILKEFSKVPLYFVCSGDQRKLTIFDAVPDDKYGRMDLHYACRKDNSYTFSVFFIY